MQTRGVTVDTFPALSLSMCFSIYMEISNLYFYRIGFHVQVQLESVYIPSALYYSSTLSELYIPCRLFYPAKLAASSRIIISKSSLKPSSIQLIIILRSIFGAIKGWTLAGFYSFRLPRLRPIQSKKIILSEIIGSYLEFVK